MLDQNIKESEKDQANLQVASEHASVWEFKLHQESKRKQHAANEEVMLLPVNGAAYIRILLFIILLVLKVFFALAVISWNLFRFLL